MIQLLLLLAKIVFFGIAYFLIIGILTVLFANLGRLFTFQKYVALIYSIITSLVYIYLYSFWGAYLKSITDVYSEIYHRKWMLIILCVLSIFPWLKFISKQLQEEKAKMEPSSGFFSYNSAHEVYAQSITVIALSMNVFILISYLVFLFTTNFHNIIFFNLPDLLSRLFIH